MNRIVLGAIAGLLFVAAGMFWWQGRAATEQGAPPPEAVDPGEPATLADVSDELPSEDGAGQRGPALPEVDEPGREERRFNRVDRSHDGLVSRNEMLGPRVPAFRKLDRDRNNLLSFEEWSVATSNRFAGADANGNGSLTRQEFATTRPRETPRPRCRC